jgi:hypothetical protein
MSAGHEPRTAQARGETLEIKVKLRGKVIDVASIDFKVTLWASSTIRRQSNASGCIAVVNIRLIVISAVKREDECLTLIVEKSALHEKRRQISLNFSDGQRGTDCNVDVGLWARWQSFSTSTNLMDLASVAGGGECPKSSQRLRRETWLTGGR